MEPKLPDLPPLHPVPKWNDEAIRSYGLQCYRMGVEAERERCATLCEGMWEIDGSHTASQFAAAIRGTDPS